MGMICRKNDTGGGADGGPAPVLPDAGGPTPNPDLEPPTVSVTSPAQNATVAASLKVVVNATDDRGVTKVELKIDGTVAASKNAKPYEFPIVLQPGTHTLTAVAHDAASNKAEAKVTVTVPGGAAPAPDSGAPAPGPTPGGTGVFGSTCQTADDCDSKLCVFDSAFNSHYCTEPCSADGTCPYVNAECLQGANGAQLCALQTGGPKNPQGSGTTASGCAVGAAGRSGLAGLALILLGLLVLVRRHRR
jgi:MYXO-CTERM domain-containing protein